ncbi:cadherin-like beta sandwich domain-containing protein [Flavobacterium sp. N502540]|uniref:cadherin-like beta sandwich domain-containing protein n=1 Tax=Flavobacterium sp. N502540 TaxID=2986838 RepID=UPI0022243E23|nr:cadherin-like beta sandwich domain-containing protein [Flavobacterium sp. N502540]
MNLIFTFFFLKKPFWVYMTTFLLVFQTVVAQETAPTIQSSNLVVTNTTGTSATISWQSGDALYSRVFMCKGTSTSPNAIPVDNVYYIPSRYFGSGYEIGTSGWYCVADTRSNSSTVYDLTPETTYQVQVFAYNYYESSNHTLYLRTINSGNSITLTTPSNVPTLSNLSSSVGTLDPVFSSETTDYKARVPNEVRSITVTPVATDANATIKVNEVVVVSGKPSQKIDLAVDASTAIKIEVTAQDGTVKIYKISVFRFLPQPTIQARDLTFTNTTSTGTTLNWTNGNGAGRIVFMREGANSGSAPIPDNIYFDDNTVFGLGDQIGTTGWYTIVKTNTNKKTVITGLTPGKTYQAIVMEFNGFPGNPSYLTTTSTGNPAAITITSNVATLSNLSSSVGTLDPVFSSETTDYKARVPNEVRSITVTPVATDANATIKVNEVVVVSGKPSQKIDLAVDASTAIKIEVTAQDGTVKIYKISVFRFLPQPTIQARDLTFTNTTSTGTTLNWTNGNGAGRIVFMREGANSGSAPIPDNIYFDDNTVFGLGDQIGTTGWYTIVKTNTNKKTVITGLTPGKTYQAIVMEFNGFPGNPSYLTTTSTGNPAAITITSNVATLSNLSSSVGTLDPVFSPDMIDYKARVPNEVSSITVTPVATDANATIKVNEVVVVSGKPSQKIDLAIGTSTVVKIEVTAQDGTVKTYTVTIEKNSLGVVENKIEGFTVYPNPVQEGKIYIQTKSTVAKNVKIFDVSGKKVLSVQTTDREVNIGDLQKGVYIMKVNQDGAEATEKLIVE